MMRDRICYVCLQPIPEREAVYHAALGILAHQDACSTVVHAEYKDHSRSERGRFRPADEVRRRVEERR
jgi:hypothetical protein